ncbi:ankyrin repeat and SAM domain-containing protein 3 [Trichonephila clavipes]|nr:ankyrin repeat and SAM domain-containing protein 3 [Trichonephila clavipes]
MVVGARHMIHSISEIIREFNILKSSVECLENTKYTLPPWHNSMEILGINSHHEHAVPDHMLLMSRPEAYHQIGRRTLNYTGQLDLHTLLMQLELSKYYYIFENHGIDIDMFWLLTEEDLKEIGIQLVGPRKKLCMVIAEWYQNNASKGNTEDKTFCCRLFLENKKLQQKKEELESALAREGELRKAADNNLNDGLRTLKNYSDTVQRTLTYTAILEEKLKQNYINFKKILCHAPDINSMKFKTEIALPLMGEMEKLLDGVHHHTVLALQQTNFKF